MPCASQVRAMTQTKAARSHSLTHTRVCILVAPASGAGDRAPRRGGYVFSHIARCAATSASMAAASSAWASYMGFQAFLAENLLCVLESLILPGSRH